MTTSAETQVLHPSPPSKYGVALTDSDWIGLPLRVGHIPESGTVEDLSSATDAVLVWSGGTTEVDIRYSNPGSTAARNHSFSRRSGALDLLPRGTRLLRVVWHGEPSICTSVTLPEATLAALGPECANGLCTEEGARFGLFDGHVVDLVQRLQSQAEGEQNYGAVYVQSLSLALASYIVARYGSPRSSEEATPSRHLSRTQRRAVETFVESELASNFGLVDLASIVGYSPDHFSRLFKRALGQSPHQYVLSRRIERAKAMLKASDHSIAEIAVACGFANQGHLTTAFRRKTGLTPLAYRRS